MNTPLPDSFGLWAAVIVTMLIFSVPVAGGLANAIAGTKHTTGDLTGQEIMVACCSPVGWGSCGMTLSGIAAVCLLLFALLAPSDVVVITLIGVCALFVVSLIVTLVSAYWWRSLPPMEDEP